MGLIVVSAKGEDGERSYSIKSQAAFSFTLLRWVCARRRSSFLGFHSLCRRPLLLAQRRAFCQDQSARQTLFPVEPRQREFLQGVFVGETQLPPVL
jgi:hypothetical protein